MGMSASQARLLSLTSRQSNLEFEGQQINQQRTNLSSQSANYYNNLLSITVPTPPSTDDYTKVSYSFTVGGNSAVIGQVLPQDTNGNYLVSYTTNLSTIGIQENSAYKITASANNSNIKTGTSVAVTGTSVYDESKQYYVQSFRQNSSTGTLTNLTNASSGYTDARVGVAGTTFYDAKGYQVDSATALASGALKDGYTALVAKQSEEPGYSLDNIKLSDKASFSAAKDAGESITEFTENSPSDNSGTDTIQTIAASNSEAFSTVGSDYKEAFLNAGLSPDDYYQYAASSGVRFAKKDDIAKSANNSTLSVTTYAVASLAKTQNNTLSDAQVEFDSAGRISTVTDADGNSYAMTANTETDNDAYENAYNKYTYDQYVYDQKQNDINSHIKILQAQDKNLELRLSQLNTEHSAIQTEIEAVNKVLSKNIETSFKTFNA